MCCSYFSYKVNSNELQGFYERDDVPVTWYVDPCWSLVFRNDPEGRPLFGSVENLVQAVKSGHAITVRVDGDFYKVNIF